MKINFIDSSKKYDNTLLTSLIIGANATGKSRVLYHLSEFFKSLEILKSNTPSARNSRKIFDKAYYFVKYKLNNSLYEVKNDYGNLIMIKNNEKINLIELELPNKLLVVSFMVTDRFTFPQKNSTEKNMYEYLGIRDTSNAAFVGNISNRVAKVLIENSNNARFLDQISSALDFLEIDSNIEIKYKVVSKKAFFEEASFEGVQSRVVKYQNKKEFRADSAKKISDNDIELISSFLKDKKNNKKVKDYKEIIYKINIKDILKNEDIKKYNKILNYLTDLKYLSSPMVYIKHKNSDNQFSYDDASSGEKHFLFTLINVIDKIEHNSLLLIDEPEISLHPNWQTKYIYYLKKVLEEYKSCHVVIATHSHLMVSDLEPKSSSIISLKSKNGVIESKLHDESTYGWSAEDILYNIFNIFTVRNYYIATELDKILTEIFLGDDIEHIQVEKIDMLKYILTNLKAHDPLVEVIKRALERLHE